MEWHLQYWSCLEKAPLKKKTWSLWSCTGTDPIIFYTQTNTHTHFYLCGIHGRLRSMEVQAQNLRFENLWLLALYFLSRRFIWGRLFRLFYFSSPCSSWNLTPTMLIWSARLAGLYFWNWPRQQYFISRSLGARASAINFFFLIHHSRRHGAQSKQQENSNAPQS